MNRISSIVPKSNPREDRWTLPALRSGSGLPSATTSMIRSTPALIPGGELAFTKQRCDVLGDDPARRDVGQRPLEAVAHLDPHLLVVLGDEEQRAVVPALAADLPFLGDPDRIGLDRLGLRRRHDQHRELIGRAGLPVGELRFERLLLRGRQRLREIGDVSAQRRDRQQAVGAGFPRLSAQRRCRQRKNDRRECGERACDARSGRCKKAHGGIPLSTTTRRAARARRRAAASMHVGFRPAGQ